jgi:magnesium-transporting ATPase (P-type)
MTVVLTVILMTTMVLMAENCIFPNVNILTNKYVNLIVLTWIVMAIIRTMMEILGTKMMMLTTVVIMMGVMMQLTSKVDRPHTGTNHLMTGLSLKSNQPMTWNCQKLKECMMNKNMCRPNLVTEAQG